jgi:hypothetical protein
MRRVMRNLIAVVLLWAAVAMPGQAETTSELSDLFGGQGCTIRVSSDETDAVAADLRDKALAALAQGQAERQGDRIVFGPETCTIRPPKITSAFALDHHLVQFAVGEKVSNPEWEEFGCFFGLDDFLKRTPPFARDAATRAYYALIGKGVLEGTVAFYSDDVLRTPIGFQLLTGDCADVPQIDAIRRNHALFIEHFDALVRANAALLRCEAGSSPASPEIVQTLAGLTEGASDNAWMFVEMMLVALGAGWVEGAGHKTKGVPRPPICTFGE